MDITCLDRLPNNKVILIRELIATLLGVPRAETHGKFLGDSKAASVPRPGITGHRGPGMHKPGVIMRRLAQALPGHLILLAACSKSSVVFNTLQQWEKKGPVR